MAQTIHLRELYPADLLSRQTADHIRNAISTGETEITLDFSDIGFISRSFADELYDITHDEGKDKHFTYANRAEVVSEVMAAVSRGRATNGKDKFKSNPDFHRFGTRESLSRFLESVG